MKKFSALIFLCVWSLWGWSQTYLTSTSIDAGNPGGVNTESDAPGQGSWTTVQAGSQAANIWSPNITIPFTFNFFGSPVTQCKASQNGLVTFDVGTAILPGANENLPSANLPPMTIAAFWDEFTANPPTGSGDDIRTNTFGTAPNRQFWIKWYSFEFGNPNLSFAYFAVVLEESTNKIYVVDQYSTTSTQSTSTIGVQLNGTTAVQIGNDSVSVMGNGSGNADNDYYEFFPTSGAATDIAVLSVQSNLAGGCGSATSTVGVKVLNVGTMPVSGITAAFSVDGGAFTASESIPGTYAVGDTAMFTFAATADVSAAGPHTITVAAMAAGDPNATNDSSTVAGTVVAGLVPPLATVDFNGFTGSNLSTAFPGWSEGEGTTAPSGTSSSWTRDDFGNDPAHPNGDAARFNLFNLGDNDWIAGPKFVASSATVLTFDLALTQFSTTASGVFGSDDFLKVMLSTDCGASYFAIGTYDVNTTISNTGQFESYSLSAYAGQELFIGFYASEGTVDDPEDINVYIDNVFINNPSSIDMGTAQVLSPTGPGCYSNAESIKVLIQNYGLNTIDFATDPTTVTVDISGAGTATFNTTLSSGTLDVDSTMMVEVTTAADLSAPGTYDFTAYTTVAGDGGTINDTAMASATSVMGVTAPYFEDFETFVDNSATGSGNGTGLMNGWSNDPAGPTSSFNWSPNQGNTASSSTGPDIDHTFLADTGTYMYTEASFSGAPTTLFSPCIDISALSNPAVSFWYHMYGSDMGTLEVFVVSGGTETSIFSATGQQQSSGAATDPWLEVTASLVGMASPVQLKFVGTRGPSFAGDMSIDDVNVFNVEGTDLEVSAISPDAIACADSAGEITVTLTNLGADTLDFGADTTTLNLDISGAGTQSLTATLDSGAIAFNESVDVTFTANLAAIGTYNVTAFLDSLTGDADLSNDTLSASFGTVPTIAAYPYLENFENGPGNWVSGGINSSWELGTPANTVIAGAASGDSAWATGLTSDYNGNENSAVVSPCFDMSNAPAGAWVSMNVWWESETSWDGAVLQTSSDFGNSWDNVGMLGDPNNWYTDGTINGTPGGSMEGWSGTGSNGSGGWVRAKHALDSALIGQSSVFFRVAFGSDGAVNDEGFAFDDFAIGVPPKVALGADTAVLCIGEVLDAGNPGASYEWSTGDSTQTIVINNTTGAMIMDSLIRVTVTDSLGLCSSDSILVSIPASTPDVTATLLDNVACNGDSTGAAWADVSGGMMPYTFLWDSDPVQTNDTAFSLPAGVFTVTVTDTLGCSDADTVVISEPTAITAAVDTTIDVACNGDSTGAIMISVMGGTPSASGYTYSWDNGATDQNLMGLPAGNYTGTITDSLGCMLVAGPISINENDAIMVTLDTVVNVSCEGDSTGSIDITVSGGVGPYTYMWDNGDSTQNLSGLPVGDYIGTIMDSLGCTLVSPTLSVAADPGNPTASFTSDVNSADLYTFTSTSMGAATFAWDFGDSTGTSTDENPTYQYAMGASNVVVTLIVTNQCGSDTATLTLDSVKTSINPDLFRQVTVFPNPSAGTFEVRFDQVNLEDVSLAVLTTDGRAVYQTQLGDIRGVFTERVSLPSTVARGVYVLQIKTQTDVAYKRIRLE